MKPPASMFPHRHGPSAAGANMMLPICRRRGGRRGTFERDEIAVGNTVMRIAGHAAAQRAFGADDLLALARGHHVTSFLRHTVSAPRQSERGGSRRSAARDGLASRIWAATGDAGRLEAVRSRLRLRVEH